MAVEERLIVARAQLDAHDYVQAVASSPGGLERETDGGLILNLEDGKKVFNDAFEYLGIQTDLPAKRLYLATLLRSIEPTKAHP